MFACNLVRGLGRWGAMSLLLAGLAVLAPAPALHAQASKVESGLSVVPADTASFGTMLRNRQQIELFYKSNAYKTLRSLPAVKQAYARAMQQLGQGKEDGPLAVYKKLMQAKENQELLALLKEAAAEEVFFYLGSDWLDAIKLANKVNSGQQAGMFQAMLSGQNPNKGQVRGMLLALQENRATLRLPSFVVGFRLQGSDKAENQLKRLEKLGNQMAERVPPLKGRFKRTIINGSNFLTLDLDGSLIPWDDVNLKEFENNDGEFDELLKAARKLTLTVSLGVQGNYLLLGLTSSSKDLAKLGGKGKTLADRPELAPVGRFADRQLTGISYVSKALLVAATDQRQGLDQLAQMARSGLENAGFLKEERRKAIQEDLDAAFARARKEIKEAGAQVSLSFLTPTGYEGYSYQEGDFSALKGVTCKLHPAFGGDPIFAAAIGCKADGKGYKESVQWLRKFYGHAEAALLDRADENVKEQYTKFTKLFFPILKRLDDTTTRLLIPAVAESGLGIVLDGKWSSKKWHQAMPPLPKELPAFELGLLLGLSDAAKFTEALREYRLILNDLIDKVGENAPNAENIRGVKIPAATDEKVKSGTLFYWPLPEELGLDKQVQPMMGVARHLAVITLSRKHAERLMTPTPLKGKTLPLARKEPLFAYCVFNWPAFVDVVYPWAVTGVTIRQRMGPGGHDDVEAKPDAQLEAAMKQVKVAVDVLKAFKGGSCATFLEGGKLVTHTQLIFKDVPAPAASGD